MVETLTDKGKYYCTLSFAKYQRPVPFKVATYEVTLVVSMPLPNELKDDVGADYSTQSLESVGDILNGDIGGIAALGLRKAGALTAAAVGAGAEAVSGSGAVGDAAADLVDPEKVTSAVQASLGLAPNPNQTVMFTGPHLRSFSFSWSFYPRSAQESQNIQNMIKSIRGRILPQASTGTGTAVLGYPDTVQINFYPWDKGSNPTQNGWSDNSIIKLKRAVVSDMAVNYVPMGAAAFFEGTNLPVGIQVGVTLMEIEYMLSSDYGVEGAKNLIEVAGTALGQAASYVTGLTGLNNAVKAGDGSKTDVVQNGTQ